MSTDIITQIAVDSDLIMLLDYSYAEANEIDTDMILKNFVSQIIGEVEPIIQDRAKIKAIKAHLGLE
jgi:hypothetical protein